MRGAASTTMDHVPPKALFPPPRPKLITVPACEICNGSASDAEEKFKVYISAKSGIDTPSSITFGKMAASEPSAIIKSF
jgi:hypothetical protein